MVIRKNKDKISFEKRQFRDSALGQIMPTMLKKLGGDKNNASKQATIIRLMMHWDEIMGADLAEKSTPLRIVHKKQKNRTTGELDHIMVLKMRAEGAFGTVIAMREAVILQRLNRLFGTDMYHHISIEQGRVTPPKKIVKKQDFVHYDLDLPEIDDPVLKNRLESLGQAVKNRDNQSHKG